VNKAGFYPTVFLAPPGDDRRVVQLKMKQAFSQGDPANYVLHPKGLGKADGCFEAGEEATITLPKAGDFVGEEAITAFI
jgi:hypothetical protein